MDDLSWSHTDLDTAKTFLVAFVRDFGFVPLLSVSDDGAVEVVVIHLEEHVVVGVGPVDHPLQAVALGEHRGENEGSRCGGNAVRNEIPALANKRSLLLLPACRFIPFGHAAGGERQIQTLGLARDDLHRRSASEVVRGLRRKSVGTSRQTQRGATAYFYGSLTRFGNSHLRIGGSESDFQLSRSGVQSHICGRQGHSSSDDEVFPDLFRFEPVFAEFNHVIAGIDRRHVQRPIGPNRSNRSLVDQNGGSWSSTLNREKRQMGDGLQVEDQFGLLAFANPYFLFG